MKKRLLFTLLALVALAVVATAALLPADVALVELSVRNLTCVACSQKIGDALSGAAGIGQVAVDVAAGRAQVEYDPAQTDPAAVAGLVTRAGYPAALRRVLLPADYRRLKESGAQAAPAGGKGCGSKCCEK